MEWFIVEFGTDIASPTLFFTTVVYCLVILSATANGIIVFCTLYAILASITMFTIYTVCFSVILALLNLFIAPSASSCIFLITYLLLGPPENQHPRILHVSLLLIASILVFCSLSSSCLF